MSQKTVILSFLIAITIHTAINSGSIAQGVELEMFEKGYPRAFFFRASEGFATNRRIDFETWEKTFLPLGGIEGKVLDEEVPGRSLRNIDYFVRYKKNHPEKLVLLHYNGNARDPRDHTEQYFAGHWIYFSGCRIKSNIPAEDGETDIAVEDASLFHVDIGRYSNSNEDIGLCLLDSDGKPDWHFSEQVQLISVDRSKNTIRVKRGRYGTKPREFPAGKSWAAAHMSEGPWGKRSNLLWMYNFSTACPRDAQGKNCVDVYVDEFAEHFLPGGDLETFDGVEFDVLFHQRGGAPRAGRARGPDTDSDGKADYGFIDGVNQYGIGVVDFCQRLRERLGDRKFILADGASINNQRAFGILNGIESEGWPHLSDPDIEDWSGGLNRHFFWDQNAREPVFNYINHKFMVSGTRPEVPFSTHRLVLAVAQFVNAAVTYSYNPQPEQGERYGIWDELRMGAEHQTGWIGEPLGQPVRLALGSPDLLKGQGRDITRQYIDRWSGKDVHFSKEREQLHIWTESEDADNLKFRLRDIPCDGSDLFISFQIRGKPMARYPEQVGRLVWVGIPAPEGHLVRKELPSAGMCERNGKEKPLDSRTGATLNYQQTYSLGSESHNAYFVHPPYHNTSGYAFWEREITVPKNGELVFYTGLSDRAAGRSDGVTFKVELSAGSAEGIFERHYTESKWQRQSVSLAKWSGQRVRLKFISDCGPKNNTTTDHSLWGDVRVVSADVPEKYTRPVRFMTWSNSDWFQAGFYFDSVTSRSVDLEFEVEGAEELWLRDLSVHASPDVIYREFDNGLVLANPSLREYEFDLGELFPGQKFRRLRGSLHQDTAANDGSPVDQKVKLSSKDGLFLVRSR